MTRIDNGNGAPMRAEGPCQAAAVPWLLLRRLPDHERILACTQTRMRFMWCDSEFAVENTVVSESTMPSRQILIVAVVACLLSACGSGEDRSAPAQPQPAIGTTDASVPVSDAAVEEVESQPESAQEADAATEVEVEAEAGFSLDNVPVSTAALGEFPYFTLPEGYLQRGSKTLDFAQMAVWTGDRHEIVEGRVAAIGITHDRKAGKAFSALEVTRNIEHVVTQAGGVKVFAGEVPRQHRNAEEAKKAMADYSYQAKCFSNDEEHVYALRRPTGLTWIRTCSNRGFAGLMVADVEAFKPTATLLPASEIKQQLDSAGKVALQVNFATDKTDILPDSLPQIEQVVELMKIDTSLQLAVNGHTDNTGDAAHNQALSEGRARAVVAALTSRGIAASRLVAKGFGDSQPVAGNDSEDGKAQNRRVELVKQ